MPTIVRHLEILDRAVAEQRRPAGEDFTLVDISVAPVLHHLHEFPLNWFPGKAEIAARAAGLEACCERLARRPGAIATGPPRWEQA